MDISYLFSKADPWYILCQYGEDTKSRIHNDLKILCEGQKGISFSSLKEKLHAIITLSTSSDVKMSHILVEKSERELPLSAGLTILSFKD